MRTRDAARLLRREQTPAEARLWEALRHHRLDGLHFRRQRPIGAFIADFYCHEARLAVEVDGGIHTADEMRERDRQRCEIIALFGVRVLRVTNEDVLERRPSVLARIREACAAPPQPRRNVPAAKRIPNLGR
jgi:very-short-patch-repair endonuclease